MMKKGENHGIQAITQNKLTINIILFYSLIFCQYPVNRVFGGTPADPDEYPWMVALVNSDSSSILSGQFCGGVLIDSTWVLTAAHCVFNAEPFEINIVLNVTDLEDTDNMEIISVDSIFVNPFFGSVQGINLAHDVALLKLIAPSDSITSYLPIISSNEMDQPVDSAWFVGWGYTETTTTPTNLMEVEFPVVSDSVCLDPQWDLSLMYSGDIQLCAGDPIAGEGVFEDDSGGPLLLRDNFDQFILIGTLSAAIDWDIPSYGVFCRLYEYRSWIESTKNRLETTSIRFSNQSNNHINIGDSLRVDGYFPLIPSNEYRHIPVNTPVLINTYKQIINNSLKQYCWNDLIEDHFLVHQTSFDEESDDYAIFNITSGINVSTNILFVPDGIDFYDPWYAYQEDGEWIQPDEFIQLNELTNDGNYNVFLDQGGTDIGNLTQPYYSLRTPIYVTDGDDTYLFDGWSGTNMSFDKLSPETPVVFHQPGSEITANYEQVQSMEQQLTIPPGFVNLISFNVLPDNPAIASIFAGVDNIMIQDDHGGFFVPGFSVNTIGDVDIVEGYKIDYWDLETVNLTVPGLPAYSHSEITINENNSMNYFPYLGRDPMDINYAFADVFEDILIVQSDMGGYYIPVYNINSIYTLYPGEAYYFTSSATYDIKYRLPRPSAQRQISEENMEEIIHQTASNYFHPQKTGSSFPVLIDPQFDIHVGDEIVAYSGDMVVGTSRVANPSEPNLIVIWNEVNENGQHLRGYNDGSPLYFRLWDNDLQIEIELLGELESHPYGDIVLKTGEFELGPVITPQKYQLYPPYPNPFNPNTTLRYDLPIRSDVSVIIYDMLGREVTLLVNSIQNAGYHLIQWDATDYATGTYFVKMTTGEVTQTQKIMLLK